MRPEYRLLVASCLVKLQKRVTDFPSRVDLDLYSRMCHGEDIWCFESLRFSNLKPEQEKAVKHLWRI